MIPRDRIGGEECTSEREDGAGTPRGQLLQHPPGNFDRGKPETESAH